MVIAGALLPVLFLACLRAAAAARTSYAGSVLDVRGPSGGGPGKGEICDGSGMSGNGTFMGCMTIRSLPKRDGGFGDRYVPVDLCGGGTYIYLAKTRGRYFPYFGENRFFHEDFFLDERRFQGPSLAKDEAFRVAGCCRQDEDGRHSRPVVDIDVALGDARQEQAVRLERCGDPVGLPAPAKAALPSLRTADLDVADMDIEPVAAFATKYVMGSLLLHGEVLILYQANSSSDYRLDVFDRVSTRRTSPMKSVFAQTAGPLQKYFLRSFQANAARGFLLKRRWYREHVDLRGVDPRAINEAIARVVRWKSAESFSYFARQDCMTFANALFNGIKEEASDGDSFEANPAVRSQFTTRNMKLLDFMANNGYADAANNLRQQEQEARVKRS